MLVFRRTSPFDDFFFENRSFESLFLALITLSEHEHLSILVSGSIVPRPPPGEPKAAPCKLLICEGKAPPPEPQVFLKSTNVVYALLPP